MDEQKGKNEKKADVQATGNQVNSPVTKVLTSEKFMLNENDNSYIFIEATEKYVYKPVICYLLLLLLLFDTFIVTAKVRFYSS